MRIYLAFLEMALAAATLAARAPTLQAADIKVSISHLKAGGGKVYVGLYSDAAAFPAAGRQWRAAVVEPRGDSAVAELRGVPPGKYAIAIYQDLNGNGILDKSFVGRPKEPYGFSNNASGKMGPPAFAAAAFGVGDSGLEVHIDAR